MCRLWLQLIVPTIGASRAQKCKLRQTKIIVWVFAERVSRKMLHLLLKIHFLTWSTKYNSYYKASTKKILIKTVAGLLGLVSVNSFIHLYLHYLCSVMTACNAWWSQGNADSIGQRRVSIWQMVTAPLYLLFCPYFNNWYVCVLQLQSYNLSNIIVCFYNFR